MKATINSIENIFKTLPTGYYLGRPIQVRYDVQSTCSYFDPAEDLINISGPMIYEAIKDVEIEEDKLEELVRGVVYHELSHVIITPAGLMKRATKKDIINIFEDERIETLCAKVYMNTNFKNTIRTICQHPEGEISMPTSAEDAFFNAVRFHECSPEILAEIQDIILTYKDMINSPEDYCLQKRMDSYILRVMDLYNKIAGSYKDMTEQMQNMMNHNGGQMSDSTRSGSSSKSSSKSSESNSSQNSSSSESEEEKEENNETSSSQGNNEQEETDSSEQENQEDTSSNSQSSSDSQNSTNDSSESTETSNSGSSNAETEKQKQMKRAFREAMENLEKAIKELSFDKDSFSTVSTRVLNQYYDASLNAKLEEIITKKMKHKNRNGAAIQGYSGRLNVKSICDRDDYRWWIKKNRVGNIKAFSKIHFNLFIDNSGSFSDNDIKMNQFIKALNSIKDPDFSFDVITINTSVIEWKNTKKIFESHGCNRLSNNISEVIKRHKKSGANNYNIVVFDGDCHSDEYSKQKPEPLRWFDSSNTILITDSGNEKYINNAKFHQAKVKIIHRDYCNVFIEEILKLLERVC